MLQPSLLRIKNSTAKANRKNTQAMAGSVSHMATVARMLHRRTARFPSNERAALELQFVAWHYDHGLPFNVKALILGNLAGFHCLIDSYSFDGQQLFRTLPLNTSWDDKI